MAWKALVLRKRWNHAVDVARMCGASEYMTPWRNDQAIPEGEFDITIRYGCTSNAPTRRVLNTAGAIHRVFDKRNFRALLAEQRLAPRTWLEFDDYIHDTDGPVVVRGSPHERGERLHLCTTADEVRAAISLYPAYYISDYIQKTHEYRVCIVQGRVAWVVVKTAGDLSAVSWDGEDSEWDNVRWQDWPSPVLRAASEAFAHSQLDFGGVDVMWDARTGRAYVCEINSAPSLYYHYRPEVMAHCFDYILARESKQHFTVTPDERGWRGYIHPALNNAAILGE